MDWSAFFTLHQDLPREGPGDRESLDWALSKVSLAPDARILDAASGPGADIAGLLAHAENGRVDAVEMHGPFVAKVEEKFGSDPRVRCWQGDMAAVEGPYDLIWCAGALYFLGVKAGLTGWRKALGPKGIVAFSQPAWFTDSPSDAAIGFWDGFEGVMDIAGISAEVTAAGYTVLASRKLPDAAWEAYYTPQDARVALLRPTADAALTAVLDQSDREAALWRAHRAETGYAQIVAQKVAG